MAKTRCKFTKMHWTKILLHDDLLATGGTMKAACELVKRLKPKKVYVNFIIELKELNGKSLFGDDVEVESVLSL